MAISRFEKIAIIVFLIALWALLAIHAGAPIFSDEFMYIDIGLRNFKEPSYGNRFFHVYMEKFFMELAPTPLQGVRIFWGFIIALTTGMIYYNARTFMKDSTVLHGILAVVFFYTFPLITEYSGEPAVDLTAMLMVNIYISVYLFGLRQPEKRKLVLIILGMLAFLAFKTKETTIFINMLLVGFFLDEDFRWKWAGLWKLGKPLLTGAGIGIFIFMLLDGFILGDPFFAISPSTFGAIFTHYDFGSIFYNGPTSWYREYFLDDLLLPFLLFVISGVKLKDELDTRRKLVWVYPLLMAAFVTVNMIKIPWGFIERFYFPALPVVAMLAPQFLRFEWPQNKRSWLVFGLLLAAAGGLVLVMREVLMDYASLMYFDYSRILDSLYYPVLLSILLAIAIWVKRFKWFSSVLPLFCIAAMVFSPLLYTYKYFVRYPKINERYAELIYPFEEFSPELDMDADDRLYISTGLDREMDMLSDDPNDIVGMYNFYYDRRITDYNVVMGYSRDTMSRILTTKNISHALLTSEDWTWMLENAEEIETVENLFDVKMGSQDKLVLLVEK